MFLCPPPYNTLQNVLNGCIYCFFFFYLNFYYQTNSVKPIYWHWGCGEEKSSIYCSCQARSPGRQLMLKSPKLPDGFQGNIFKGGVSERVTECMTNSTQISALGEGSRVMSQVHIINPQAPVVWGICAHGHQAILLLFWQRTQYLQNNSGMYIRLFVLQGGTKIPWLLYGCSIV